MILSGRDRGLLFIDEFTGYATSWDIFIPSKEQLLLSFFS